MNVASLLNKELDPGKCAYNHSIVFDLGARDHFINRIYF